jgi:hypothetical protein
MRKTILASLLLLALSAFPALGDDRAANVLGDSLLGDWRQYILDERSKCLIYGGTFRVSRAKDGSLAMAYAEPPIAKEIILDRNYTIQLGNTAALYDLKFDGAIWYFKSKWANDVGEFFLRKIDEDRFEGNAFVGATKGSFNRWERVR